MLGVAIIGGPQVTTVLLPTAVGGHLAELMALVERLPSDHHQLWMTWRNAQTESLLAGRDVVWVDAVPPRDWSGVLRAAQVTRTILRERSVSAVLSTGSGIAFGVLAVAAAYRIPCHFVESATRPDGPSMTARLLRFVPGVHLYTQYPEQSRKGWLHRGSVFEGFEPTSAGEDAVGELRRVVVTLGTMQDYPFRRLLDRLVEILPPDVEVLWQTGCTPTDGLPIRAQPLVSSDELGAAMADADVVVGHCGVGTALAAMTAGRFAVLVPREAARGENVDDHQLALARELDRLRLAATPIVEELDLEVLLAARKWRVERLAEPPPFRLTPLRRERRR